MTTEDVTRDLQFLTGSRHRPALLEALSEEPLRPTELCDRTDATRTTVQRILAGFRERSWVEKRDGRYRATITGQRIDERYRALATTAERADQFAPLATHFDGFDEAVPSEAFETGTITAASEQNPLAAVDRVTEWLEASEGGHIKAITPIVARSFNETIARLLETGLRVEMVIDEGVLERSAAAFETALDRSQEHDGVSVWITPEPLTDGLFMRADSAGIAAYDETNNLRALLESDDESYLTWAHDQFATIKSRSRPLADVHAGTAMEDR